MNYALFILRRAQKELAGLPKRDTSRIQETIFDLSHNPRPKGCSKLAGREGWRIRVGDYRVLYDIDDAAHNVTVVHIGHRRNVYR